MGIPGDGNGARSGPTATAVPAPHDGSVPAITNILTSIPQTELDAFVRDMYRYYVNRGYWPWVVREAGRAMVAAVLTLLLPMMVTFLDWQALLSCGQGGEGSEASCPHSLSQLLTLDRLYGLRAWLCEHGGGLACAADSTAGQLPPNLIGHYHWWHALLDLGSLLYCTAGMAYTAALVVRTALVAARHGRHMSHLYQAMGFEGGSGGGVTAAGRAHSRRAARGGLQTVARMDRFGSITTAQVLVYVHGLPLYGPGQGPDQPKFSEPTVGNESSADADAGGPFGLQLPTYDRDILYSTWPGVVKALNELLAAVHPEAARALLHRERNASRPGQGSDVVGHGIEHGAHRGPPRLAPWARAVLYLAVRRDDAMRQALDQQQERRDAFAAEVLGMGQCGVGEGPPEAAATAVSNNDASAGAKEGQISPAAGPSEDIGPRADRGVRGAVVQPHQQQAGQDTGEQASDQPQPVPVQPLLLPVPRTRPTRDVHENFRNRHRDVGSSSRGSTGSEGASEASMGLEAGIGLLGDQSGQAEMVTAAASSAAHDGRDVKGTSAAAVEEWADANDDVGPVQDAGSPGPSARGLGPTDGFTVDQEQGQQQHEDTREVPEASGRTVPPVPPSPLSVPHSNRASSAGHKDRDSSSDGAEASLDPRRGLTLHEAGARLCRSDNLLTSLVSSGAFPTVLPLRLYVPSVSEVLGVAVARHDGMGLHQAVRGRPRGGGCLLWSAHAVATVLRFVLWTFPRALIVACGLEWVFAPPPAHGTQGQTDSDPQSSGSRGNGQYSRVASNDTDVNDDDTNAQAPVQGPAPAVVGSNVGPTAAQAAAQPQPRAAVYDSMDRHDTAIRIGGTSNPASIGLRPMEVTTTRTAANAVARGFRLHAQLPIPWTRSTTWVLRRFVLHPSFLMTADGQAVKPQLAGAGADKHIRDRLLLLGLGGLVALPFTLPLSALYHGAQLYSEWLASAGAGPLAMPAAAAGAAAGRSVSSLYMSTEAGAPQAAASDNVMSLASRQWSAHARVLFREVNEPPGEYEVRLALAAGAARDFLDSVPTPMLTTLAGTATVAIAALLLPLAALALVNDGALLHASIEGRPLITIAAGLLVAMAVLRGVTGGKHSGYAANASGPAAITALQRLCLITHQYPARWPAGRRHVLGRRKTMARAGASQSGPDQAGALTQARPAVAAADVASLYPYRVLASIIECLGALTTPLMCLLWALHPSSRVPSTLAAHIQLGLVQHAILGPVTKASIQEPPPAGVMNRGPTDGTGPAAWAAGVTYPRYGPHADRPDRNDDDDDDTDYSSDGDGPESPAVPMPGMAGSHGSPGHGFTRRGGMRTGPTDRTGAARGQGAEAHEGTPLLGGAVRNIT